MNCLLFLLFLMSIFAKISHGRRFRDCVAYDDFRQQRDVNIAMTVNLEETAELPCHFCARHNERHPMIWFQFVKSTAKDQYGSDRMMDTWSAQQVKLDTHRNENLNKVSLSGEDHTLVIKDMKPGDIGTYFCAPFDRRRGNIGTFGFMAENGEELSAIQVALAFQFHRRPELFSFLVHLDVVYLSKMRLVSRGMHYPLPADPKGKRDENWMAVVTWAEWGECNICGMDGERRREGICKVRKFLPAEKSYPEYIEKVLSLFPVDIGVECASSVFSHNVDILDTLNEIEVGSCLTVCEGAAEHSGGITGNFVYKKKKNTKESAIREKLESHATTIVKEEGSILVIACAGSSPLNAVSWWKDNSPLVNVSDLTEHRMSFTLENGLRFAPLFGNDSGDYHCQYGDTTSGYAKLWVTGSIFREMQPYWIRLLFSYLGIFIIYVCLLCIKYKQTLYATKKKMGGEFFDEEKEKKQIEKELKYTSSYGSGSFGKDRSRHRKNKSRNNNNNTSKNNNYDSDTDSEAANTDWTYSSKATSRFVQFSASRDAFLDTLQPSPAHYFVYLTDPESSDHSDSSGEGWFNA